MIYKHSTVNRYSFFSEIFYTVNTKVNSKKGSFNTIYCIIFRFEYKVYFHYISYNNKLCMYRK